MHPFIVRLSRSRGLHALSNQKGLILHSISAGHWETVLPTNYFFCSGIFFYDGLSLYMYKQLLNQI